MRITGAAARAIANRLGIGKKRREPKPIDTTGCGYQRFDQSLVMWLPFPPSVNNYRAIYKGRFITSKQGREWRKAALKILDGVNGFGSSRVAVKVQVNAPDRRARDLANLDKAIGDALQAAGVFDNDSQIDDYRFVRGMPLSIGRVVITVDKLP